jgi:hypothetical protein
VTATAVSTPTGEDADADAERAEVHGAQPRRFSQIVAPKIEYAVLMLPTERLRQPGLRVTTFRLAPNAYFIDEGSKNSNGVAP